MAYIHPARNCSHRDRRALQFAGNLDLAAAILGHLLDAAIAGRTLQFPAAPGLVPGHHDLLLEEGHVHVHPLGHEDEAR